MVRLKGAGQLEDSVYLMIQTKIFPYLGRFQ
jgi:hypothetical protein